MNTINGCVIRASSRLAIGACVASASLACSPPAPHMDTLTSRATAADALGTADNFLVLGASTVTSTGPTVIAGNVGLSPGTAITGFPPGTVLGATHAADGPASQAQSDLNTALTNLKNEPCGVTLTQPELGGSVLTPGVYCFASPSAGLTGALTLDAQGKADAVFVFQIASTFTSASRASVVRINGGSDCNIFWEVGSSATLGTGTQFRGNILASASITAATGATVSGRLLAHTGAVTLDSNVMRSCVGEAQDAGSARDSGIADTAAMLPDTATSSGSSGSSGGSGASASGGSSSGASRTGSAASGAAGWGGATSGAAGSGGSSSGANSGAVGGLFSEDAGVKDANAEASGPDTNTDAATACDTGDGPG